MEKHAKHLISGIVLAVFVLLAWGSIPRPAADASTASVVAISDCAELPPVSVRPTIRVILIDYANNPLPGLRVDLFYSVQDAVPPCTPEVIFSREVTGTTDAQGVWEWTAPPEGTFHGNNAEDLIRMQINVPQSHEHGGVDVVEVFRYHKVTTPLELLFRLVDTHNL